MPKCRYCEKRFPRLAKKREHENSRPCPKRPTQTQNVLIRPVSAPPQPILFPMTPSQYHTHVPQETSNQITAQFVEPFFPLGSSNSQATRIRHLSMPMAIGLAGQDVILHNEEGTSDQVQSSHNEPQNVILSSPVQTSHNHPDNQPQYVIQSCDSGSNLGSADEPTPPKLNVDIENSNLKSGQMR